MRNLLFSLLTVILIGCSSAPEKVSKPISDDQLISQVNTAFRKGSDLKSTFRLVGIKPTLSSKEPEDMAAIQMADFVFDDPAVNPFFRNCRDVAYWVLKEDDADGNPNVVGIVWHNDGRKKLFRGAILPPS